MLKVERNFEDLVEREKCSNLASLNLKVILSSMEFRFQVFIFGNKINFFNTIKTCEVPKSKLTYILINQFKNRNQGKT